MIDFAALLVPPEYCTSIMGLPSLDKRKGGLWYCEFARKITGKGRKQPPCLCRQALKGDQ